MEKKTLLTAICLLTLLVASFTLYKVITGSPSQTRQVVAWDSVPDSVKKIDFSLTDISLMHPSPARTMDAEIDTGTAQKGVDSYRIKPFGVFTDTKLVTYSPAKMDSYMTNNFSKIVALAPLPAGSGLEWHVGYCPMKFDVSGISKTTIAVMPVLINNVTKKTYDYFECAVPGSPDYSMYTTYYAKLQEKAVSLGFKSFIYDEGHLYP